MSACDMRSGRLARTASRTFSLWRSQSRAPRENSSYQEPPRPESSRPVESVFMVVSSFAALAFRVPSLLRQESGHVVHRLLGAVLVVAVVLDEPLLHRGDLLLRLFVGARPRRDQPQNFPPLLEQVLLDGVVQAGVAVQAELLTGLERHH